MIKFLLLQVFFTGALAHAHQPENHHRQHASHNASHNKVNNFYTWRWIPRHKSRGVIVRGHWVLVQPAHHRNCNYHH